MKHDIDRSAFVGQRHERAGDPLEPVVPVLAAVAGDEDAEVPPRQPAPPPRADRQRAGQFRQRVDAAVAGNDDFALDLLAAQVRRVGASRREQEVRHPVDRDAVLLLGPGQGRVVASKARLDMAQRRDGLARGERSAECARRVALHQQQVDRVHHEQPAEHRLDNVGVEHRVGKPGTGQGNGFEAVKPVNGKLQPWVLAGDI